MNEKIESKNISYCGVLREENVGEIYSVNGWVAKKRNLGSLTFIDIRDRTGILQLVIDEEASETLKETVKNCSLESVIKARGLIRKRSSINNEIETGKIELLVQDLLIYSKANPLPMQVSEKSSVGENTRLKYRYLDLRRQSAQNFLFKRSKLNLLIRNFLNERGFIDVETPLLARSTPEGARDYLVPSRVNKGEFYALPQSPQQFKQLLMVAGFDKYYQIAKCLRDEDLRADRQPEFTQVDIEMSFTNSEEVMELAENLLKKSFDDLIGYKFPTNLHRMTYKDAMDKYGTDKPDMRFEILLNDVSDIFKDTGFRVFDSCLESSGKIKAICVKNGVNEFSAKGLKNLENTAKKYGAKGLVWVKFEEGEINSSVSKFVDNERFEKLKERLGAKTGDLALMIADSKKVCNTALGGLRLDIANKLNLIDSGVFKALWVVDMPMFEYDDETERYYAAHHPFTMPHPDDIELVGENNDNVRALSYDLVINGYELAGGSIRIHDEKVQSQVFKALGFTEESIKAQFGYFVEALKYGTPPHGGIAFGLDRFIMLITETENIKDVIAFPKNQNASCVMTSAPSEVDLKQLEELSIIVKKEK